MLVLSVRQPWAFAICAGIQDVLNLRMKPPFEIPDSTKVLICAKGDPVPSVFDRLPDDRNITIKNEKLMGNIPPYEDLQYDAIIGFAECAGVTRGSDSFWADQSEYDWETPIYHLTFKNPFLFSIPKPVRKRNYGPFFRVSLDKNELLDSHKVNLRRPHLDGTCLKMPAAESVLQSVDDGREVVSYDLCETNIDYFFDSATELPFPIESIDFIGKERTIHKEVICVEKDRYEDETGQPIHLRGYDPEENKKWEAITFHIR